jgi:prolipoprotein diacylglyceryltransferase
MKFLYDSLWELVSRHWYHVRNYKKIISSYMFIWFSHLYGFHREGISERLRTISDTANRAAEHVRTSQNGQWLQSDPQHLLLVLGCNATF